MRHWVEMVTEPGETVFDPFCGSGTTGVAALETGRRFLGGDVDPAHVETTRQRLDFQEGGASNLSGSSDDERPRGGRSG